MPVANESALADPSRLDLPTDFPRRAGESPRRAAKPFSPPAGLNEAVTRAGLQALLLRYASQDGDSTFRQLMEGRPAASPADDITLEWNGEPSVNFNAELFKPETIDRMIAQLETLLETAVREPNRPISELPILPEPERKQLLVGWNETRVEYPATKCVHELIEEQAARTPDRVAVVFEEGSLSYAELNARADALAAHLQRLGVGPETRVGISVRRSLDMVVGLLGILKAGGAYVPMDPGYPKERLAFMMQDSQAALLLTQSALKNGAPAGDARVVCLDEMDLTGEDGVAPMPGVSPDNLAYIIYTSGSTGKPKGVMVQHRNVVNFMTGADAAIGAEPGVWLAVTSISFDISVLELFWTLSRGFKVVIQAEESLARKAYLITPQIVRQRVTHFQCTPSLAGMLLEDPKTADAIKRVRKLIFGGEPLPPALLEKLGSDAEIFNFYGPTETAVYSTFARVKAGERITIGRPIANTQIYILDRRQQVCPINVPGELYIGGAGVVRGYLNRPELTAERFLPDPFSGQPGARMYRTGDLARYLPDGRIEFLGRLDHQVKLRGFRIELGEIETAVRENAAVKDCVVSVCEAAPNDKRLVAYLVVQGAPPPAAELRLWLKQKLPEYMVPSAFVPLSALPLTPNGKIDRNALPNPFAERASGPEAAADRKTALPLTEPQREIWLTAQMGEAGSAAFNQSFQLELRGRLDEPALGRAINQLVQRHEALRLSIGADGQQQFLHEKIPFALRSQDISAQPEALERIQTEEVRTPFDFEKGPLFRMKLVKVGPQRWILIATIHHIVCDSGAFLTLLQELGRLYACDLGEGPPPEPALSFSAFVLEQKRLEQAATRAQAERFWIKQFETPAPVLNLPGDHPRPSSRTFNGAITSHMLDRSLVEDLRKLSAKNRCTLFTTLLAAYYVFLHRLSGQMEIVAGVPFSAREGEGSERLAGHAVNFLPLRVKLEGNPKFVEHLARVRDRLLDGHDHQNYTYGNLIQKLQLPRDASRMPLLDVVFNLDHLREEIQLPGIETKLGFNPYWRTSFDLNFNLLLKPDGLEVQCQYSTDLFEPDTIQRWLRHFQTLLAGIAASPEAAIGKLPLLTPEERRQIVEDWNRNELPYPKDAVMHGLFERQVRATPERIAVRGGKVEWTYADLDRRANEVAHWLQQQSVRPQTLVGVCMERTPDLIAALLGIMKAGCAYVPLDPGYPEERLQNMLRAANAPIVLSSAEMPVIRGGAPAPVEVKPENLAYVMFTSGSTGGPKAVGLEHRNGVAFLHWARKHYSDDELSGVLASTSICFDLSVFEIFVPLSWGGTIVLADGPLQLPNLPAGAGVKLVNTLPTGMAELVRQQAIPPSVQTVNLAGEALSQKLVEEIYDSANVTKVYDLYGPTENTTYSTFALRQRNGRPTIGKPLANSQAYIFDGYGEPAPIGVPGELYVGGALLAREYLNNPELTAQKFIVHPALGRLYRTGDLARYFPNGDIEFLGRIDHQIKIRGYRIEPGEIENELANHPGVREKVVVMREDVPGQPYLAAYVVARPGSSIAGHDLRQYLHEKLPAYMVPSAFVVMEKFPQTPNGKVDRRALPASREVVAETQPIADAPLNEIENALAEIWREVIRVDEVRRGDNFFDLGGHSVLVTQMLARVRRNLGVELTLRNVFEAPSLGELARIVEEQILAMEEEVSKE